MKSENGNRDVLEDITMNVIIPGIYNYCDRWCLFCNSKKRCSLYMQDRFENRKKNEDQDTEIVCIMEVTRDFLEDYGDDLGIQWEEDPEEEPEVEPEAVYDDLNRRVSLYAEQALNWVQTVGENAPEIDEVLGSMHIIGYYTWIIMSKIYNASLPAGAVSFPGADRNGFIKAALVSLDKSLKSFMVLYTYFPACQDELLSLMKDISWIVGQVEQFFPEARNFVRPGLDE